MMTDTPMRERIVEAMLEARNLSEVFGWSDGMTEGVARIEKMLTEKQLDAVLEGLMRPDDAMIDAGTMVLTAYWERKFAGANITDINRAMLSTLKKDTP